MTKFEVEYQGKGIMSLIGRFKVTIVKKNEAEVRKHFKKVYSKAEILNIKEV